MSSAQAAAPVESRPVLSVGPTLDRSQVALAKLRDEKATLKRQLRAFDDAFAAEHGGRAPSKAEKEHLRPLYTRYHALKAQQERMEAGERTSATGPTTTIGSAGTVAVSSLSSTVARRLSLGSDGGVSSDGGAGLESGVEEEEEVGGEGGVAASAKNPAENVLILEKKSLQAQLRTFERDFEAKNGRKVKFVKDIEAVKDKYSRYKALKALVKAAAAQNSTTS